MWFGERYHWRRRVSGKEVDLDRVFEQDLFDFRTTLGLRADGEWASSDEETASRPRFEIRSRFFDTLSAPYWRAHWRTLPDPGSVCDTRVKAAIGRYNRVTETVGLLRSYLVARVQALRWIEERVKFKNDEIVKPPFRIADLANFSLGVHDTGRAAVDFLRLDHHVKLTDWLAELIQPSTGRVHAGRTLPVRDVRTESDKTIVADFDLEPYGLTSAEMSLRSSVADGAFVRLCPREADLERGQTIRQVTRGGITCRVVDVDWDAGRIRLSNVYSQAGLYVLGNYPVEADQSLFSHATIDDSVSDFVSGRVEGRLLSGRGAHVYAWLDPEKPEIPGHVPIAVARRKQVIDTLGSWKIPTGGGREPLTADQRRSVEDGLETRVQLLQGPPGTGKTVTTATAILCRAAARLRRGDIVLVGANTHTAVDTLLERLAVYVEPFRKEGERNGLAMPTLTVTKVHSSDPPPSVGGIENFKARPCATQVKGWITNGVLVIGGTTSTLLKMAAELSDRKPWRDEPEGFQVRILVVDEASMMVFPHFLSLATLVHPLGEIMLSGDNRQLAPIVAHDWEHEDRPPAQLYQPFKSAYEAVRRIIVERRPSEAAARLSQLTFTFRLPPVIRNLIARIYRDLDEIELQGPEAVDVPDPDKVEPLADWGQVWQAPESLFLIVHGERASRQSNVLEARIIESVLGAPEGLEPDSIAVITPHRAQRALLRERLTPLSSAVTVIDTVERLQGGERPFIIVSATVSDPSAISAAASFILNLNRANVAFSRTKRRLMVVCSNSLLDHIPAELEDYENALLWKALRRLCVKNVWLTSIDGHEVRILSPEAAQDAAAAPSKGALVVER